MTHTPTIRRSGFTLIELLVVISIIAVLASMLLPAVGMIRDMANQQKCGSNERQLMLGVIAYATDNDGLACPAWSAQMKTDNSGYDNVAWVSNRKFYDYVELSDKLLDNSGSVKGELPRSLMCPNATARDADPQTYDTQWAVYALNITTQRQYLANQTWEAGPWNWAWGDDTNIGTWAQWHTNPIDKIANKAGKVSIQDSIFVYSWWTYPWGNYWQPVVMEESGTSTTSGGSPNVVLRHRGKTSVAFWDGHAGTVRQADVEDQNGKNVDLFSTYNGN